MGSPKSQTQGGSIELWGGGVRRALHLHQLLRWKWGMVNRYTGTTGINWGGPDRPGHTARLHSADSENEATSKLICLPAAG